MSTRWESILKQITKQEESAEENDYLGQPRDPSGRFARGKQTKRTSSSNGRNVSGTANRPKQVAFYQKPPTADKPNRKPGRYRAG